MISPTVLLLEVTTSPKGNLETLLFLAPGPEVRLWPGGGFRNKVWRVDRCLGHSQVVLGQPDGARAVWDRVNHPFSPDKSWRSREEGLVGLSPSGPSLLLPGSHTYTLNPGRFSSGLCALQLPRARDAPTQHRNKDSQAMELPAAASTFNK